MKKSALIFTIVFLVFFSGNTQAKGLWAFLTYSTFNSPEGTYIETYLTVAGNSVKYVKKDNGKYQATVNILMTFKQNNDIRAFKKYELNSPEISDTLQNNYEFLDEQRFQVPNGTYDFELLLSDKNSSRKPVPFTQSVLVDFPADKPSISGIQLVQSYTKTEEQKVISKNGYDLVPYVYNFYPQKENRMILYCELYNLDKSLGADSKYILSYYIESFENNIKFADFAKVRKETAKPISVLMSEFAISNLATGNYNLVVEARNQQNEVVVSKKLFFQRSNPNAQLSFDNMLNNTAANTFAEKITNLDTLRECVSCLFPISYGLEKEYEKAARKSTDIHSMQQFFYGFWVRRDANNPEKAWLAYKEQVAKADANFKTPVKKGYQTDRGRVFLEYGPPNVRSQQYNEPAAYPYEIWQYYTLNNSQRNRKFVFYSPDMVSSDFFLLHSDATGEITNPQWRVDLMNRVNAPPADINETETINSWGSFSKDYWDLPN
jgi:GWxTD domain-containing protein